MKELVFYGADGQPLHAEAFGIGNEFIETDKSRTIVLLHGGGPDHRCLIPLAERIADCHVVVLPDVRGYGRSRCTDPARHTWTQYADDVLSLLDHLGIERAILGGTGLGTTISLRTAVAYPERVQALVLVSVEDIEDDAAKQAEIAFIEAFADCVRHQGIEAAWRPILKDLAPIIGELVREAIPRSDPASIAAAANIGRDRSFRSVEELATIDVPTLIFPGMDSRHPTELAEKLVRTIGKAKLSKVRLSADLRTADDLARILGPPIRKFLQDLK